MEDSLSDDTAEPAKKAVTPSPLESQERDRETSSQAPEDRSEGVPERPSTDEPPVPSGSQEPVEQESAPPLPPTRLQLWAAQTFSCDLRSLALCRIATGVVIAGDLVSRMFEFKMHYTDLGIYPRQLQLEQGLVRFPSVYLASGWEGWVVAMVLVHLLLALTLSMGYQTRVTSVLLWYWTASLQQRSFMVNNGGDAVLILLLLWAMFVPWGEVMSIDAAVRKRDGQPAPESLRVYSPATVLLLVQMPTIYLLSAFHKLEPIWFSGDVLYYAFNSDFYARPSGQIFLPHPTLMKFLAHSTLAWEFFGPFLLFSSRPRVRLFTIAAFAFMHLNFGVFLRIGTFSFTPSLFLLTFLPAMFWDLSWARRLVTWLDARFARWGRRARPLLWGPVHWTRELAWGLRALFFYGFLLALGQDERVGRLIPRQLDWVSQVTGLYQRWTVFIALDNVADGWFVVEGKLSDGTDVDLFQGFSPVRWDKPPTPYSRYDHFRWPTPMVLIVGDKRYHRWFVRALALDWEADHPGQKVVWARFNYMREKVQPGFQDSPPAREVLWEGVPLPE